MIEERSHFFILQLMKQASRHTCYPKYVRFSKVSDGVDSGYPRPIAGNWPGLPASFNQGIDAALLRKDNHKIYFFKETQYVRFSSVSDGVDSGYLAWINGNWMPFPK